MRRGAVRFFFHLPGLMVLARSWLGRSYHFSGGDWLRGGWRMRTDCLLLLPTLTFLTSLLAALFARDRLHQAFLDTVRVYLRFFSSSPLCAAVSLRDSDGARELSSAFTSRTSLPLMYLPCIYQSIFISSLLRRNFPTLIIVEYSLKIPVSVRCSYYANYLCGRWETRWECKHMT